MLEEDAPNKHPAIRAWLVAHPRFKQHFEPTFCSWLNPVEGSLAKLTTQRFRRGSFDSVQNLQSAIHEFVRFNNAADRPFKCTVSAEYTNEKVNKCGVISENLH